MIPKEVVPRHLLATLDPGEAAVIAAALARHASLVAIDELAGRRIARLHGLEVTGSLGLLVRACRRDARLDFSAIVERMRAGGIYYSDAILARARSRVQQEGREA